MIHNLFHWWSHIESRKQDFNWEIMCSPQFNHRFVTEDSNLFWEWKNHSLLFSSIELLSCVSEVLLFLQQLVIRYQIISTLITLSDFYSNTSSSSTPVNYNTETTERWSEQQRSNNSNCQGWDVWDSEWTTSSWSWTVRDGTVGGRRRYSAVHGVLLGNRRLWHLCECYFGAYHQPKHCCRQFTSRHGSSMFFFQQTNAPCHNPELRQFQGVGAKASVH